KGSIRVSAVPVAARRQRHRGKGNEPSGDACSGHDGRRSLLAPSKSIRTPKGSHRRNRAFKRSSNEPALAREVRQAGVDLAGSQWPPAAGGSASTTLSLTPVVSGRIEPS